MKTQKQEKNEDRRPSAVDSENNGNVEVGQMSQKKDSRRSNITKPFRAFHNWCNNIKE